MLGMSVVGAFGACSRVLLRRFSSGACQNVGMKERMRKFILENPHLAPSSQTSLNLPVVKGVTKMQQELLEQIEVIDVTFFCAIFMIFQLDFKPSKIRHIRPNSKENPLLVGSNLERKVENCLCYPDVHYVRSIVLYRDLPIRCQCGHWFKLIDMERFEQEREKRWAQIKDEPENAKLLQDLTDSENELNRLMDQGKNLTKWSPGVTQLLEKMAAQWEKYKNSYVKIRHQMDLP
ncbi:Cytochrome c oxidase subunit 5B [Paragonimus heterotremus]|uniref:Cytochrome c oxidase subunit 5B n=1 Tax=Paragonimus heterotremus TaxID=100268 RepID=A0A8J4T123_9TREM|nr:Cytochrome c oxidase subunit 5B [Paragonimus heterotremus]